MDLVSWGLIAALIALVTYLIYLDMTPPEGFPKGPKGIPVLGSALSLLGSANHLKFEALARKYGPIAGLKIGPWRFVMLSDTKIIKEAFSLQAFTGRADVETFSILSGGKYGIINADGDAWTEQRRFAIRHLRDLGFGKSHMEDLIMEEVNEFLAWLKQEEGQPVALEKRLSLAVLNSIWVLLHGQRYQQDDPKLHDILEKSTEAGESINKAGILFTIPILAKTFPNASGYNKVMSVVSSYFDLFKGSIEEHRRTADPDNTEPRDLVEAYLMEMQKQKDNESSSFNSKLGEKNLYALNSDMFVAGHETTTSTVGFLLLYVAKNPHVQRRIQEELDRVVGKSRKVSVADRPALPYFEAVMIETYRRSAIVALGLPKVLTQDIEFHGHKLPKGTMILSNIYAVHHDPEIWSEPMEFKPERFLSEDGSFVSSPNVIPFSVGKRSCVGELMARNEVYLFCANLFQRFSIKFDPNAPEPSEEPTQHFVFFPKPYKLVMTDRQK